MVHTGGGLLVRSVALVIACLRQRGAWAGNPYSAAHVGAIAFATIGPHKGYLVEIVCLNVDTERPSVADDQPWFYVEQLDEGVFLGNGGSWKTSGAWVGYRSLSRTMLILIGR